MDYLEFECLVCDIVQNRKENDERHQLDKQISKLLDVRIMLKFLIEMSPSPTALMVEHLNALDNKYNELTTARDLITQKYLNEFYETHKDMFNLP